MLWQWDEEGVWVQGSTLFHKHHFIARISSYVFEGKSLMNNHVFLKKKLQVSKFKILKGYINEISILDRILKKYQLLSNVLLKVMNFLYLFT